MKRSVTDLALFGGEPLFDAPLHVGAPNLGDLDVFFRLQREMFERRWLTNHGPLVEEFEEALVRHLGARHVIATCNATVGLELASRALRLSGEVLVPAFTFVATAHALRWQEIRPVFVDVQRSTHTIDVGSAERMITPNTTGIVGVHLWGRACDHDALQGLADAHGLQLMYDGAHAFGCSTPYGPIGALGAASVFSFHATKFINTFEGGAIATDDDELAERLRLMTNFGFRGRDRVDYLGINGKMTEVAAAMGLAQLAGIGESLAHNRRNHVTYRDRLAAIPGIRLLLADDQLQSNHQYAVTEIDQEELGLSRDRLFDLLTAEGVLARRYFSPGVHRMEPYRSEQPHAGMLLPVTEGIVQRVLVLPTGTAVSEDDVRVVCDLISFAAANAGNIMRRPG